MVQVATQVEVEPDLESVEALEALWRRESPASPSARVDAQATITIARNAHDDFQDRQIYLWLDGEALGKIRYGEEITRDVEPGLHRLKAFNTLFRHELTVDVRPGEQVRVRCRNGIPAAGWLMLIFLHVTALRVRLERES